MINTNEIAKEYRLSHWAQVIQRRADSGMSIREYCISIGISENTYFYWQRRVRQAACDLLLPTPQTETVKPAVPIGWALAEPAKEHTYDSTVIIEAGSYRIKVTTDTDMELLAKVCRMLVKLC